MKKKAVRKTVSKKTLKPKQKSQSQKPTTQKTPSRISSKAAKTSPKIPKSKKKSKPSKSSGTLEFFPLQLVVMNESGKVLKRPTTKNRVIYGIQKGKLIKTLNRVPQPYIKAEAEAMKEKLNVSQGEKGSKTSQVFFEVKTNEILKDENGNPIIRKVKIGTKKVLQKNGKRKSVAIYKEVPTYRIKIQSKPPTKNQEWRQVIYQDGKRLRTIHPYFQKRDTYERVTAEILNRNQATSIKGISARTIKAFQITSKLHGKTLAQAIKAFQPPVSDKWLKRNKIEHIVVYGTAQIKTSSGETHEIKFNEHSKRFAYIPTSLGRSLRMALARMGKTFTAPAMLKQIGAKIDRKYKGKSHTTKAKNEKFSFAMLMTNVGNKNVLKHKLDHVTNITIDMKIEFMRDDLPVKPKRKALKKKSAKKKGTKK